MTVGNGVMAAFGGKDKAAGRPHLQARAVARRHMRRPSRPTRRSGFYAAYFRDPDGNKLNAFVMG